MATYEVYVGGPGRSTGAYGRSQFPAVPFNASLPVFQEMKVADHKATLVAALTRTLNFTDHAMLDFLREDGGVTLAQGDKLGIIVMPKDTLLYGVHVEVENPVDGLVVTLSIRGDATNTFAAIDADTAGSSFLVPTGVAAVTNGAVDLSNALFKNVPYIFDLELTTVGAAGFKDLVLNISPLVAELKQGRM